MTSIDSLITVRTKITTRRFIKPLLMAPFALAVAAYAAGCGSADDPSPGEEVFAGDGEGDGAGDESNNADVGQTAAMSRDEIMSIAVTVPGYSYHWGHGRWRTDGADSGSCSGSCPSCSHKGSNGADCSGFVAKAWQVPGKSALDADSHPYSTVDFRNKTTHWDQIDRKAMVAGDAMVYNSGGSGHIFLYDKGDPWGSMWTYECMGCAKGCVHQLRTAPSKYIAIRRRNITDKKPVDPPKPTTPLKAIAAAPSGKGYWEVAEDGAIFSYGDAHYHEGANSLQHAPIIALASTPSGGGYALLANDGAVYAFGDAKYKGGANEYPHTPVVGIAYAQQQVGYWIASDDGAIYAFGDAPYLQGANTLQHAPIVGIASTPGSGYWLVANDGAVYAFGDAVYYGGANQIQHAPIIGMARTPSGAGYWLMANDGAIYAYGDAQYKGGANTFEHPAPIVSIAAGAGGYWQMASDGAVYAFGVDYYGGANGK